MRFYSKILYGIIISSQAHNHAKHGPDLLDQFKLELILLYTIGKRIPTGIFIIVDLLEYRFIHFTLLWKMYETYCKMACGTDYQ